MNKITWFFLSFVVVTAQGASGQELAADSGGADFFVAPSLLYYSNLRKKSSSDENAYLVYELKAGYQVHTKTYLGLTYQVEEDNSKTSGYSSASLNNISEGQRTSLGATIGYITPSIHLMFTYFWDSKWDLDTTTSTAQNSYAYTGKGMQLDIGYKIPLGGFYFGPQVSYKAFTYNKLSTDGGSKSSISPKLEDTSFDPSLVFLYYF